MPDLSSTSMHAVVCQLNTWAMQCLLEDPDQLGGVSLPVFMGWLRIYATSAVYHLMRLHHTAVLPNPVVRMIAAAAFGAVRYLIHAGTTWTPLFAAVMGFQLDELKPAIRWMLRKFTPKELRSWERKTEK